MPVNGSRSQTNNNMDLNSSPGSRSQQLTEDEISMGKFSIFFINENLILIFYNLKIDLGFILEIYT